MKKIQFFLAISVFVALSHAHSPFNKHYVGQRNINQSWNQQTPSNFPADRRNGSLQGGIGTNAFDVMFQWNIMDYEFPSANARANAIATRQFVPQNVIPLGVAVNNDRIFVSTPRWNDGEKFLLSEIS